MGEIVGSTVGVGLSSLSYTSSIITLSVTFGVGSTFQPRSDGASPPHQNANTNTAIIILPIIMCLLYFFIQYLLKIITF